jgi:hypothetical protein
LACQPASSKKWTRSYEKRTRRAAKHAEKFAPSQLIEWRDAGVSLVEYVYLDVDVAAEQLPFGAVLDKAIERGERIRWNRRTLLLDDVAVIIIVRRLHQHDTKTTPHPRFH